MFKGGGKFGQCKLWTFPKNFVEQFIIDRQKKVKFLNIYILYLSDNFIFFSFSSLFSIILFIYFFYYYLCFSFHWIWCKNIIINVKLYRGGVAKRRSSPKIYEPASEISTKNLLVAQLWIHQYAPSNGCSWSNHLNHWIHNKIKIALRRIRKPVLENQNYVR